MMVVCGMSIIKRGKFQKRWFMLYGYDLNYYEDPDDLKTKKVRIIFAGESERASVIAHTSCLYRAGSCRPSQSC